MKPKGRVLSILGVLCLLMSLVGACGDNPTATPGATTSAVATTVATATTAPASTTVAASATTASGTATTAAAATTATNAGGGNSEAVLTMICGLSSTWLRNFNPFTVTARIPTLYGIYEPMMIYNTVKGELVPWLADKYTLSADSKTLTFTLHDGVKWSDGQTFTANDVVYTFNLLKNTAGLAGTALTAMRGNDAYVESVTAPDAKTVVFNFKQPFSPAIYDIAAQIIVPEHIWKDVTDPVKFTNENPVATGPFTQVSTFQAQTYQIDRNPNYWQPGKPAFKGIRCPAFSAADQANLELAAGKIDWAANGIPNVENVYVSKNPATNGYWFPTTGGIVTLDLNTTKKPFDDPNVRKAISMGINRQQITSVAVYGYVKPADVTGIADGFPQLKVADPATLGDWTNFNTAKANQLLDAAGLKKGSDGIRTMPDGSKMQFKINVAATFAIHVSAAQIIVQNLKAIGIDATLAQADAATWRDRLQKGNFELSMDFPSATNFYAAYRTMMSAATTAPIGSDALGGNYGRYVSQKGEQLLKDFSATADPAKQKDLARQIQQVFADEAPLIPLYPSPVWYEYNSSRFDGFPSKDNPYVVGSFGQIAGSAEPLIVLTNLKPKG
ncbi:MAG: ABC transporter substrate-binding protein [Chloroflexi bacterium]|nr:ABC transporter substrate-binding protein [Chloroflexota bacterium]OJV88337.1 MAG: hypothetical protein BGO39_23965 [Chloroflexi bacterium 54-19]